MGENELIFSKELARRFVSDYDLPIPVISKDYFMYHISLYEEDYASLTKYRALCSVIEERYGGDAKAFMDDYYRIREDVIRKVSSSEAFKRFNEMDMSDYAIKEKTDITSGSIYNNSNIGGFFISVDMRKANFQTLKKIDRDIMLGHDTYEGFIGEFTDLEYIRGSKYFRNVVFGMMNPKRHITAEKYFMTLIYRKILDILPNIGNKCVSLSNDEAVFKVDFMRYNDKMACFSLRRDIERIASSVGFEVHVEFFHLRGYSMVFRDSRSVRKTFFVKDYFCTDGKFRLIGIPLQYHSLCYKLYKGMDLNEIDYHFDYEGMDARFCEEFDIEEIES